MAEFGKERLRFTKTSCYYCSEWLDEDKIEDHLFQCRRTSIACPDGCGTIVTRQNLQAHRNHCSEGFGADSAASTPAPKNDIHTAATDSPQSASLYEQVNLLGEELQLMRLALSEEVYQRAELMAQLAQLKRRSELADKWTAKVNAALVSFNKLVNHETNRRSVDVSGLEQRQSILESWRLDLTTRFNSIESRTFSSADSEPSYSLDEVQNLQQQVDRVEQELLRLQTPQEAAHPRPSEGKQKEATRASEHPSIESLCSTVKEVVEQQAKMACRLQDALQQVFENEERVQAMVKQLERYRRETYYTKQRLDALQGNLRLEERLIALSSSDGRVIWRIDEFEKRFLESKDNDTMLKGPTFTNHPNGYVLQLEVSLYGIGTWRGRNLIAGLTVLKGNFDSLLEWPCMLTGTIRLRDQPEQRATAMDICKPIVAKRKDQKADKHQYVYIPHEVVRTRQYIRDDTIFLEVILDRSEREEVATDQ